MKYSIWTSVFARHALPTWSMFWLPCCVFAVKVPQMRQHTQWLRTPTLEPSYLSLDPGYTITSYVDLKTLVILPFICELRIMLVGSDAL